jgi:DNA-binding NarL/FixJ family response regulator
MITKTHAELSAQELQVLCQSWEGLATKEIASKMGLSWKTIKNYRASIYVKFGVSNVAGMIRQGVEQGYLSPTCMQREEWP